MVNVNKIKELCRTKGVKQGYLCSQLGVGYSYLNDVSKGKNTMSDDRIFKVAKMLDTTFEYLTDLTDNPDPNFSAEKAESPEEKLIHTVIERVMQLSPEQVEVLQRIFEESPEDFDKALAVWKAMR